MGTGWQEIWARILCHRKLIVSLLSAVILLEYILLGGQQEFILLSLCTMIIVTEAVLDGIYMRLYHRLSLTLAAVVILSSLVLLTGDRDFAAAGIMSHGDVIMAVVVDMASGFLVLGGLMLILFLLTRKMGFGDVCYGGALGIMLGPDRALVAFFLTFWLGLLYAAGMYIGGLLRAEKGQKAVPLGPFMATGSLISMIYGKELMAWYLRGF